MTDQPRTHELKVWPEYWAALESGAKTFEYRRDDRGFAVGDILHLREWEPLSKRYTGRDMRCGVTYLYRVALDEDFVVLALDSSALLIAQAAQVETLTKENEELLARVERGA